jgi:hypothetical protein
MDAKLTDEGEVRISGEPMTLEEKNKMQMQKFQQQNSQNPNQGQQQGNQNPAFEGNKPFKKENIFPNEKGKSWIVTEVETKDE